MELKTDITLVNNVYHAAVDLGGNGLTSAEAEAINSFGAPYVSCGGEFGTTGTTGATGTNTYFTLESNDKQFPTSFPIKQTFSLTDYPEGTTAPPAASKRANTWRNTMVERITAAVTAKRAVSSLYLGQTVQIIDTTP